MSRMVRTFVVGIVLLGNLIRSSSAGEVQFEFLFASSFDTSAGAFATAAKNDFEFVGSYLSTVIKTSGEFDITMKFSFTGSAQSGGSLASAGSDFWGFNNSYNKTISQIYAQTGINRAGADAPVGSGNFNFHYDWGYGGSVDPDQYDFRYVVLHEMSHALGLIGAVGSNGSTKFANGFYGWMDQDLYGWNGTEYQKLVDLSGSNLVSMSSASSAVTNDANPVQYRGFHVRNYLNSATGQDMYTPATFRSGSSIYHVDITDDLFYYATAQGPQEFGFSGLHKAFLMDLGYVVVPEPGTFVLAGLSIAILVCAGRSRSRRVGQETNE